MALAIRDEVIEELLQGYRSPEDLLGEEGLFKELKKRLLERALGGRPRVEVDDASSDAARAIAQRAAAEQAARAKARQQLLDHPAVREAIRAFGGARIVDVRTSAEERSKGGERR